MTDLKKALQTRKLLKGKKPQFTRQDAHKKSKLGQKWRRPKGIQSKMRLNLKGYPRSVSQGYSSPGSVRGLGPDGLQEVLISNFNDLEKVDTKTDICVLSSTLGMKKKYDIVKKALSLELSLRNLKDPQGFLKQVESLLQQKKTQKKEKAVVKEKKKKEKEKVAKEKETKKSIDELAEEGSSKDAKMEEKKEQDKVLVTKGKGL